MTRSVAAAAAASRLRIAVVQTVRSSRLTETRDRMIAAMEEAADRGARVVVFSEGALGGADTPAALDTAMDAIRSAAQERELYVIIGVSGHNARAQRWVSWLRPQHWINWIRTQYRVNWMVVVGPDGRDVFRYDKLYDRHDAPMPGVFLIDDVPCSAIICSDRWLRGIEELPIQQGAQISFELSNNFPTEWVPAFQWYWYVPRALRNNVWVIFANRAGRGQGHSNEPLTGHGHSAVVAPDGAVVAHAAEEEGMILADLEIAQATRAGAIARAAHPALREFWSAGDLLQRGGHVEAPRLNPLRSPQVNVTLAVAPVSGNLVAVKSAIQAARLKGADLIAFPAGAVDETEIDIIRAAARDGQITVVIGAAHRDASGIFNSAFVIGPDGSALTRYDQLSAEPPFLAGTAPAKMWFSVKGIPAIVVLERDALWTELAELAAIAGARIVVHLDRAADSSFQARQTRLQVWSNLASFLTLTATASDGDASLWDDLLGMEKVSAEEKWRPRPDTGAVAVYSPWSAKLIARASSPLDLLVATRRIPTATNPHYPLQTARYNPQMDAWYRLGAALVRSGFPQTH
ncbi:MAG: carbon-nitrogen hydrolase family protein [Gammaproteobacteria bacterium]|nr:carbon-nitrogen hydrolase family protein [Gammaproteobacteria bacterium]